MNDIITVTGVVATTPRHLVTTEGLAITSLRLASSQRHYDQSKREWVDDDTNWFTITGFRQLALNIAASVNKGDRVVVSGKLKVKEWEAAGKTGKDIEIVVDNLGHDLRWGTSTFTKVSRAASAEGPPAVDGDTAPSGVPDAVPEGWAAEPDDEGEAQAAGLSTDGFIPVAAAG